MKSLSQIILTLCLVVGLLLPKIGAVLVQAVPGFSAVVICTGSETVTIVLDDEGVPVEFPSGDGVAQCLAQMPPDDVQTPVPAWHLLRPEPARGPRDLSVASYPHPHQSKPPERAPPVVV